MTGQDDDRRRIEELLPFYVNGTLEDAERAEVEAALAADETLQWDLEFLQGVRDDVRARDPGRSPGAFGLARLMRDIGAAGAQAPRRTNAWKIAAIAAVALFAVQTAVVFTRSDGIVWLAGGGGAAVEGTPLTVGFAEDATEGEIRGLLLALDLEIVGGPSALGLYTVVVPEAGSVEDALAALNAASGIVESAEEE